MAASGTYGYAAPVDEILIEAWERCGKAPSSLNGDVARSARRSLQLMLLDWGNRGLELWRVQRRSLIATAGSATVPLTAECVDALEASAVAAGAELGMTAISRDEYFAIPVKGTPGRPTQYWVERVLPAPVLHLYPTPDQAYPLAVSVIVQPQDVVGLTGTLDLPILYAEAATAGLAARLAVKFAPERAGLLGPDAEAAFARASMENRERVPLRLAPTLF